jgi:hypothetical protein
VVGEFVGWGPVLRVNQVQSFRVLAGADIVAGKKALVTQITLRESGDHKYLQILQTLASGVVKLDECVGWGVGRPIDLEEGVLSIVAIHPSSRTVEPHVLAFKFIFTLSESGAEQDAPVQWVGIAHGVS